MMRLKTRDVAPPETEPGDSFRFTHPETGHKSAAIDWWTWRDRIVAHRKANQLPLVTMEEAEHQLCQTLPPEWCSQSNGHRSVNTRLSLGDIWEGTKAHANLLLGRTDTVSQAEADRRARICVGCFLRVRPQGCGACHKMSEFVGDAAKLKTAHDAFLEGYACAACGCSLKPVVWFPLAVLEENDTHQELYPSEFCWRSKRSPNYQS